MTANERANAVIADLHVQMEKEAQHQLDLERMIVESRNRVEQLLASEQLLLNAMGVADALRNNPPQV